MQRLRSQRSIIESLLGSLDLWARKSKSLGTSRLFARPRLVSRFCYLRVVNLYDNESEAYKHRRLNSTSAARELGVSRWVTSAIKLAGRVYNDSPFDGRYTTPDKLEAWFRRHRGFVASHFHRHKLPIPTSVASPWCDSDVGREGLVAEQGRRVARHGAGKAGGYHQRQPSERVARSRPVTATLANGAGAAPAKRSSEKSSRFLLS